VAVDGTPCGHRDEAELWSLQREGPDQSRRLDLQVRAREVAVFALDLDDKNYRRFRHDRDVRFLALGASLRDEGRLPTPSHVRVVQAKFDTLRATALAVCTHTYLPRDRYE